MNWANGDGRYSSQGYRGIIMASYLCREMADTHSIYGMANFIKQRETSW